MKPARLTPPARTELRNAAAWYAERSPRLGRDFVTEVRRTLEMIEAFPGMGAPVPYVAESDTRRFPIRRFPYQVVYVELEDRLEVIAIAGDSQRPGYWTAR